MVTKQAGFPLSLISCGACQTTWSYICPVCSGHFCTAHGNVHKASVRSSHFSQLIRDQLAVDRERAVRDPQGWAT
jgi:hypothetical protein